VKTYQTALNKNLFSIILAFLMFVPKYALAVDNPFSDRINYSFFIQFCLLIIVLLAVLILTNTQYWRSQTPRLKVTIVTLGLLLTATTTHFLFPSPVQNRPPIREAKYATSCPPLGEHAVPLGLEPEDRLIDIRLPAHFQAYHIKGSCNLDPSKLLGNTALVQELEGKPGQLIIATEKIQLVNKIYRTIHLFNPTREKWMVYEAGHGFFLISPGDHQPRLYKAPMKEITHDFADVAETKSLVEFPRMVEVTPGYEVEMPTTFSFQLFLNRVATTYNAAWPVSIMGNSSIWRDYRESALLHKDFQEVTKIVVGGTERGVSASESENIGNGAWLMIGAIDASVSAIENFLQAPLTSVLLLCSDSINCMAAEALAVEMGSHGIEVKGYIQMGNQQSSDWPAISYQSVLPAGSAIIVWLLAIALSVIVPGKIRARIRKRNEIKIKPSGLLRWTFAAILPLLLVELAMFVSSMDPSISVNFLGVFTHDFSRLGMHLMGFMVPLTLFLLPLHLLAVKPYWTKVLGSVFYWVISLYFFTRLILMVNGWGTNTITILGIFLVASAPLAGPCFKTLFGNTKSETV
jgi:hypothetical protein